MGASLLALAKSIYHACKRARDDSQSVVDIDKRMYVFTLLIWYFNL